MDVVLAEHYVQQPGMHWIFTVEQSRCGVGTRLPAGSGGALDPEALQVRGAAAPEDDQKKESNSSIPADQPPPPPLTTEMKDTIVVTNSIRALSPRIVAAHGPTRTGKSTAFPLAVAHWTHAHNC